MPALRKQYRRKLPAAGNGCRILEAPGLEQLNQLLARSLVVPLAVASHEVEKVVDPKPGPRAAVKVPVPHVYIEAARKKAAENAKAGEAKRYFTYYFFDPRFPESTDVFPGR